VSEKAGKALPRRNAMEALKADSVFADLILSISVMKPMEALKGRDSIAQLNGLGTACHHSRKP